MKSKLSILILLTLMLFTWIKCSNPDVDNTLKKKETEMIQATLLNSKIVNYFNLIYEDKPAWLEYQIELLNKTDSTIYLCGENTFIIIKSNKDKFIDSLEVFWGKKVLSPEELDTIRVVDLFLDKPKRIDESKWLNPEEILFYSVINEEKDSNNCISEISIKKDLKYDAK